MGMNGSWWAPLYVFLNKVSTLHLNHLSSSIQWWHCWACKCRFVLPITGTYTRSQMMQVPSVLAVTHSSLFFFTRMQDTEDWCSFRASSSFWIWQPICHTLTWKPQGTGSKCALRTFEGIKKILRALPPLLCLTRSPLVEWGGNAKL